LFPLQYKLIKKGETEKNIRSHKKSFSRSRIVIVFLPSAEVILIERAPSSNAQKIFAIYSKTKVKVPSERPIKNLSNNYLVQFSG